MNDWKKLFCLTAIPYVLIACSIITGLMFTLIQIGGVEEQVSIESYQGEIASSTELEHYVTLSLDVHTESKEPEITQEPIEAEPVEIEEVKYPLAERYKEISITSEDIDLMVAIVYLESNNQCFSGQRMVAEVILNRILQEDMGGKTVYDVVYEDGQFETAPNVHIAEPNETNYQAVYAALNETPITDENVVYFAQWPLNDNIFCKIGDHWFCYK